MKQIFKGILGFALALTVVAMLLSSCAERYTISGTSLQSIGGANIAILKSGDGDQTVDSCEIIHGQFSMNGPLDSVRCASLILGEMNVPIILEEGNIEVSIDNSSLKVSGTPLNNRFYTFLNSRDSLTMLVNELPSRESKMILEGIPEDEIYKILGEEEAELRIQIDKMDSAFIMDNYENVLGPTWFLRLCLIESMKFGFPTTNPLLDEVYGKAPDSFRNNKDIVEFMNKANGN